MRVLHYIPGFEFGGIETLYLSWYKYINRDEVEFELLLRSQNDACDKLEEYRTMGGKYYRLPTLRGRCLGSERAESFKHAVKSFFREHHDYDILHSHGVDLYIYHYAKKYGIKKIIVHAHTSGIQAKTDYIRHIYERINDRMYADVAMACSMKAATWKFGGTRFKGNNILFIKNAIDVKLYRYDVAKRKDIRDEFGLNNKIVIGHVGRMCYPKNEFYLLDIINALRKKNPDIILMMVGDGPDRINLEKYTEELDLSDCVIFTGARTDVPRLLQGMDVFLLPSRFEGFPVTVLEAEATGIQCFISDRITEEVDITDLVVRLSIDSHPSVWADEITRVLSENSDMSRSKYSDIVAKDYGVENETKRLVEMYHGIMER